VQIRCNIPRLAGIDSEMSINRSIEISKVFAGKVRKTGFFKKRVFRDF
jgi:hypothetical protein